MDKIIDFLGFVFSWDDTLETSDSIVAYVNAGSDYGQEQLALLDQTAQKWVKQLKDSMEDDTRHDAPMVPISSETDYYSKDTSPRREANKAYFWSLC